MSHITLSLFSRIYVNTTFFLVITCTLVATCVLLGRLEYSMQVFQNSMWQASRHLDSRRYSSWVLDGYFIFLT